MRIPRLSLTTAAVTLSAACLLAGCGDSDEDTAAAPAAPSDNGGGTADATGCLAAFPLSGGMTPDIEDADLVPDDFPEPPVEATLCLVTGTAQTGVSLGYVSEATEAELVDGYLEAFSPYGAVSKDDGHSVSAQAGDVALLVIPQIGKYQIQLATR